VRDVSFAVHRGETVGFLGRNGSGKSTLLKLASRIYNPTSGSVAVNGRASALLELGAGFHQDLSGRENIYLNGSLLGLSRRDMNRSFDSIVDFSELASFIDMPVRHYSSGMYMRLAFSVAVHVEPDILFVDEILAVGDQAFQSKCIDRIFDIKQSGVTIVIVSHDLRMLRNLCSRMIWIHEGTLRADGRPATVLDAYEGYSQEIQEQQQQRLTDGKRTFNRWGSRDVEITGVRILNGGGAAGGVFKTGDPLQVEISFAAHRPVDNPQFALTFFRWDGVQINGPQFQLGETVSGPGTVRYDVSALPFRPTAYNLSVAVYDRHGLQVYDYHDHAYHFTVISGREAEGSGLVDLPASWAWQKETP
jgi:ABC-type polysaccharide/polyol phosphate transport system ATPase subunit